MGDRRGACRMLVDRPEGKGLFRKPGLKWEENFKLIFKKWDGQACIGFISLRMGKGGRCL